MIAVTATLKAKEGQQACLERVIQALAEKVRSNEPDCRLYQLSRSKNDPQNYLLMERYTDASALGQHSNTEYFKAAVGPMMACLDGPPRIELFDEVE